MNVGQGFLVNLSKDRSHSMMEGGGVGALNSFVLCVPACHDDKFTFEGSGSKKIESQARLYSWN